jgi:GxxExxY protein
VILELKSVLKLAEDHYRQLYNYLRATDCEVGLLLNFGPQAEFRRALLENDRKPHHKSKNL